MGHTTVRYYFNGFEYDNSKDLNLIHMDEGVIKVSSSATVFQYEYFLKDHLGNTRIAFVDNSGSPSLTQSIDYYPFGLAFDNQYISGTDNKYLYNGKELQDELNLNWYDYGARFYDPQIARWTTVDPKADQSPGWTPYRAFFNNPIRYIDPDGLFEIETGKIEKGDNLTTIAKQLNETFKTNLTVEQIAKANNIKDVNKIRAGEFIKLLGADVELNFDLNSLKVSDANYNVDMPGLEWKGTSGREGYQNPESQNLKDKGPIPEGQYLVDPARTQSISDISSWDRFKGNFGGGTWPGLEKSWGEHRTWLTPSIMTNTFGRSGFTIHGGAVPGSAGCIDLTSRNNSFHSWLKSHNKPLILNVKY